MDLAYLLMPFLAWLVNGSLKFAVNSLLAGKADFARIGYGGFPSTHAAIICSAVALVGLREGIDHPAFGIGVAIAFIVLLDAASLRRKVGEHATRLNALSPDDQPTLRERVGHTPVELLGGVVTGCACALLVNLVL